MKKILENHEIVIISQRISKGTFDFSELLTMANSFIGQQLKNGIVKFTGNWFDCQISNSPEVEISISLGVIK